MNETMFIVKIVVDALIVAFVVGIIIYAIMCNSKAEDKKDNDQK